MNDYVNGSSRIELNKCVMKYYGTYLTDYYYR